VSINVFSKITCLSIRAQETPRRPAPEKATFKAHTVFSFSQ